MNLFEVAVLTVCEYAIFALLCYVVLETGQFRKTRLFIVPAMAGVDFLINQLYGTGAWQRLISIVLFYLFFHVLTAIKDFKSRLIAFFTIEAVFYLLEYSITITSALLLADFSINFTLGLLIQVIITIIIIILSRLINLSNYYTMLIAAKYVDYIMINIFLISIVMPNIWSFVFIEEHQMLSLAFILLIIIAINGTIINQSIINKGLVEQLAIMQTYEPIIGEIIDDIRKKQHDYHNHLRALSAQLVVTDSTISIDNYISDLQANSFWQELIKLDHRILIGLLYSKQKEAAAVDIALNFNIACCGFSPNLSDYQLVEVCGILIDNAIEHSQKCRANAVELSFDTLADGYLIRVTNVAPGITTADLNAMFKSGYSTKSAGRGHGLAKLSTIIKRTNGRVQISLDKDKQTITFELYLNEA